MPNKLFLICIRNPFEKKPFLFCNDGKNIIISRDVLDINSYEDIYSYGFEDIVDELRNKKQNINPKIFDLVTAVKLITGKPKSFFNAGNESWSLKNILGKRLESRVIKWLNDILQLKQIDPTSNDDFEELLNKLMKAFVSSWTEKIDELKSRGEWERYNQLEVPLYNIFLKVQLDGILINQDKLNDKLLQLKKDYYVSLKYLELKYDLLSYDINSSLDFNKIKKYHPHHDYPNDSNSDFWEYAKIMAEIDEPFFSNLLNSRNSKFDYEALLKYNIDKYKRIYPRFDIMGTVTGRIQIVKPGIQYLKKTSRSFFEAGVDSEFLYADFDMFEPGILAQISNDKKLIDLYNSGDIYNSLSNMLFKTKDKRKLAKTLFLAYSYGMTEENLEKLILSIDRKIETLLQAKKFFNEFSDLKKWKKDVCEEAKKNGFSSSIFGNRRYIERSNYLTYEEQRWIPNQIIQGTASVIFKKSILAISNQYPEFKLLIPMHDAILIEVKKTLVTEAKRIISEVFNKNFQDHCPDIKTSVSFESFSN